MASMVIPVPPSVMLANALMTGISEDDIVRACYDLIVKTDHFKIYIKDDDEEIKKTNFAIEIISDYLKGIAGKDGITGKQIRITGKQFRRKFYEIQTHLRECSSELDFGKLIIDLFRLI